MRALPIIILALYGLVIEVESTCAENECLSPSALAVDTANKKLYIAGAASTSVLEFDTTEKTLSRTFDLPGSPGGLICNPDASLLYVACGGAEGKICVIDLSVGEIASTIPVGHTPVAPTLDPRGGTLYVCNRFDNDVAVIDLKAGKITARIPVAREPIAAAIAPDGKFLFVANLLPSGPANRDVVAAAVSVIDTDRQIKTLDIELPNGSTSLRGICVSPNGKFVYVTHILARFHLPTTQLQRGWMNTNALSIIDVEQKALLNTVLLDDLDLGAANPWGVACSLDGAALYVTHAGTNEISVIDRLALHRKLAERPGDLDIPNELTFLRDVRHRVKLEGVGPRGIVVAGDKVFVAECFSDSIGIVKVDSAGRTSVESIPLGDTTPMSQIRKGEMLFHSAEHCFQQWQSCSSCHPDARADGLNWDLLNDGMGNPRNTKSLLLAHRTPPAMITGIRANAELAVRSGIRHIQFSTQPEEDALAIDAYLKSLEPESSPYLENGNLTASAQRGEPIFDKAGCVKCHSGPLHTDQNKYRIGAGTSAKPAEEFDTPTLVEVWRTAPYLNDGRAATIEEVLTNHNPNDRHGRTSDLSDQEIGDLTAFVLSW